MSEQFEYNEYINVMSAGVVASIGENNVNFLIDEYKKGGCDYALDLLCDSLDKDENEISYAMRQALVIEAMNYMLEKQKFESDKGEQLCTQFTVNRTVRFVCKQSNC